MRQLWALDPNSERIVEEESKYYVNSKELPELFPTQFHEARFWEILGRTVGTFGFLEEILAKAIFAFTATKPYEEAEVQEAFEKWLPKLESALTDQLFNLTKSFGKAVREHPMAKTENLDDLIESLKQASKIRNVLCHGSWSVPDSNGRSIPFFVNRKKEVFETPVDIEFLIQVQAHVKELICDIINSVTQMGLQFPGSNGPGRPIW